MLDVGVAISLPSLRLTLHIRFLYADPTPNALQVFLTQEDILNDRGLSPIPVSSGAGLAPGAASAFTDTVTERKGNGNKNETVMQDSESDTVQISDNARSDSDTAQTVSVKEGVWINADPLPGCIVCNIGESASLC